MNSLETKMKSLISSMRAYIKRKKRSKFSLSNRYRHAFFLTVFCGICIVGLNIFYNKGKVQVDDTTPNRLITQSSSIKNVRNEYNPSRKALASHFYIGNQNNVDDVSDEANLQNVRYDVTAVSQNNPGKKLKTDVIRVNDRYIVVITKGVDEDFKILRVVVKAHTINKHLETELSQYAAPKFYIYESKLKKQPYILVGNYRRYEINYHQFLANNYRKQVKKYQTKVANAKATIAADKSSIKKLEAKKETAVDEEADDLQRQIDTKKDDIKSQTILISEANKTIEKYKDRLISNQNID